MQFCNFKSILIILCFSQAVGCSQHSNQTLSSPDKHLSVQFSVDDQGSAFYTVTRDGQAVLKKSALGIALTDTDFGKALVLETASAQKSISDDYEMQVGKKSKIHYQANEQTFTVTPHFC